MTSGASATNSAAYLRMLSALPAVQRIIDPHVAAVGPSQLLQRLQERCQCGLGLQIVLGQPMSNRCAE